MPAMSQLEGALLRSAPWRVFATRVVLPWALQQEQLDGQVLEVGCGSGAMSAAMLNRYPHVHLIATDIDPQMVMATGRRLARFGERATVTVADASHLPFQDDEFDAAVSVLMLHHVGDWERALRELVRVVRPGGRVLGCDMRYSRLLDWSERTFGSGDERLVTVPAFNREADRLTLDRWRTESGPLHTFRFFLIP